MVWKGFEGTQTGSWEEARGAEAEGFGGGRQASVWLEWEGVRDFEVGEEPNDTGSKLHRDDSEGGGGFAVTRGSRKGTEAAT